LTLPAECTRAACARQNADRDAPVRIGVFIPADRLPSHYRFHMTTDGHAFLGNVMDLLLDVVCVVDTQERFAFVSAASERVFGYRPEEMIGRPMIDFVLPEDRPRTLRAIDEILGGQPKPHFENRYLRKDGRVVHISWSARWSQPDGVRVAVARDMTERRRAESLQAALYAISEAAYAAEDLPTLFEQIHQIVGALLPAVNFFVALYDEARDELSFPYFVDEHDQAPAPQKLNSGSLSAEVIRTGRALLLTPDTRAGLAAHVGQFTGATKSSDWLGVPLIAQKGVVGALVVQSYSGQARYTADDVELLQFVSTQVAAAIERKQVETWLKHTARHDPLTDLPNRALFLDRLQIALAWARRDEAQLALLYIDLDMFKQVNDSLGHAAGDMLLQQIAHRLKLCLRESDTVGRVGGDEFLVLLNSLHAPGHASTVAEKIRAALREPFDLPGGPQRISSSIGIALYPDHGDDCEPLIARADEAMYVAKKEGGNRFRMAIQPDPAA
jgi:diguanylate cyclase (GGDEF)-like protein/PAS domain S-box-containing protein